MPLKNSAKKIPAEGSKKSAGQKTSEFNFPVVGIGASAGGLEAFELFFRNLRADSGMSFVLVSHLDPGHESILTEILQRTTAMTVIEAQDQMKVEPDHVYVIPPNRDMAIFHGKLQLSEPILPRGQRMPIDYFLRSLAEDMGERSIGIVLSGTGTDGTLGLRAIIGSGGISLVQEPASAKYDGMPTSAIQSGYTTHVLPPDKMPAVLLSDTRMRKHLETLAVPADISAMGRILLLLRSTTGHDFSLYKKSTIGRRIERRMSQHDIENMDIYLRYLKEHPPEIQLLFKELLINVTSFFRDPESFEVIKKEILPQLFENKPEGYVFRAWVAGCATGEEAYSLAIMLREFMDDIQREFRVQLYATDLDEDAISIARTGLYPPNITQDVSPERLRKFFIKDESGYRIKKDIREMIVFAVQNAIKDPPFTRLDLLCCRNLMIYLETELQNRLIPVFHYALNPGGVLFLSPSEGIGAHHDLFTPLNRRWKLYRVVPSPTSTRAVMSRGISITTGSHVRVPEETMKKVRETNFADLTKRMLLQSFAPASVVTDLSGNILFVHGETGKYLRPAPGQATLNVVDMAHESLQLELRVALQNANQGNPTPNRDVTIKRNGETQTVSLSVRALPDPDNQGLLLISFQDVIPPPDVRPAQGKRATGTNEARRIAELERELAYTKENLQATIEEQQASNEELKSTNEELQSTNEELQSTNEELETSKEELQSVNEELTTVNAELQAKIEQLAGMQNDMKNLLDNINIGTIFLDEHLHIRRFTREAANIYRLVATDVGRSLGDIKSDLVGNDLMADAQEVLEKLVPCERELHTTSGTHYLIRIQPYRTLENVIEGVVLTFTDISQRIAAEAAVEESRELAQGIVDTVREPMVVLDDQLLVVTASRSFYQFFRTSSKDTIGMPLYELGNGQWDIPALRELLEKILPQNKHMENYIVEHDFPLIGHQRMMLDARSIIGKKGDRQLILLRIDLTNQTR